MDKNKYVEKALNQSIPPLIPYKLVDEYGDFINDEMRNVVRANCLRRYLEGAIDLLIKDKVLAAGLPEEKWNNYNLNICQHLKQLKNGEYQRDEYRYFVVKDA